MRLLLDTHFIIWLVISPTKLSRRENELIFAPQTERLISVVSLWEVRMKWDTFDSVGKRKGAVDPAQAVAFAARADCASADLTPAVLIERLATDIDHADPFDRMLLVHAQHLGARLLTRDRKLAAHPLAITA